MVGDGSQRAEVETALAQSGCADCAWLPGMRADVDRAFRAFDVFALPSLGEGISNTILEAMASGLPVVATRVGGNAELVGDGETGILVPRAEPMAMAQALRAYVDDTPLRLRHGAAGRIRAEAEFSLTRMAANYMAVYDAALGVTATGPVGSSARTEEVSR
jgi:glycosyltransferase involved in cell wall biosynthesis